MPLITPHLIGKPAGSYDEYHAVMYTGWILRMRVMEEVSDDVKLRARCIH